MALPDERSCWPLGDIDALVGALRRGELDNALEEIIATINHRMAVTAEQRLHAARDQFSLHDRVRFDDRVKPQYLRGEVGEISEFIGDAVVVCLGAPLGKFKSGHVRCSPEMLEPV